MQLNTLTSEVVLSNVGQTTHFQMDANAKAFRVLSDTMYSNKIGSMVREISCNAYDSHVMAGIPEVPFQLHLPDAFEPWFSVKDSGLGLDEVEVRDVFTCYFRSTKDTNNNVVGAFGLGSKTPFAYTDGFTIVAIKNGKRRQYSAYIDGTGLPSLSAMSISVVDGVEVEYEITDEANGVEIIVPVTESGDFAKFRREVQNQLTFFTVKPEILNSDNEIEFMDWSDSANYMDAGKMLVGGRNAAFQGVWIVQGVVGYKMDVELVKNALTNPANREFLDIIRVSAILKFDLGTIEVAPSRETLSYSKYTLANIETLIDDSRLKMKDVVQAQIDAFPDNWTRAEAINTTDALRRLAGSVKAGFEAPAYFTTNGMYYIDLARVAAMLNGMVNEDEDADDSVEPDLSKSIVFNGYSAEYTRRTYRWKESGLRNQVQATESFLMLVKDTSDKPVVRSREFMSRYSSNKQIVVLANRDGSPVSQERLDEVLAMFGAGYKGVTMMSDVELPEAEPRNNNGYKSPTAYTYTTSDDFDTTRFWQRETAKLADFEDGGYYVIVERNKPRWDSDCKILCAMSDAGLLDRPIVAIREKDVRRVEANSKWIPAATMAKQVLDSITGNKSMVNAHMLASQSEVTFDFLDNTLMNVLQTACKDGTITKSSPVYKMARLVGTMQRLKDRSATRGYGSIAATAFRLRPVYSNSNIRDSINNAKTKIQKEIVTGYPMLRFIQGVYCETVRAYVYPTDIANEIVAYVNMKTGA